MPWHFVPGKARTGYVTRTAAVVVDTRPKGKCCGGAEAESADAVAVTGPGDALHAALSWLRFEPDPECPCEEHAAEMNARGVDWCLANLGVIVGWLEAEAHRRGLPFVRVPAKLYVKRVLRRHKRDRLADLIETESRGQVRRRVW